LEKYLKNYGLVYKIQNICPRKVERKTLPAAKRKEFFGGWKCCGKKVLCQPLMSALTNNDVFVAIHTFFTITHTWEFCSRILQRF
jgi:hypothetical protein